MFSIAPSARLRPSPFYEATVKAGVTSFTVYNRTMLPTGFGDPEAEYWRLINGVSMWDVAAERQIELKGPDAARLAQILAPRNLTKQVEGQGKYAALCDHTGTLINDPIVLKIDDDCYWFSIADSNMLFWARAIASERGLDVSVEEADVSPLAVQGPKGEDVVASIFGDWVRELKYFWFKPSKIGDIPVMVARSGWSKQGGFEIYLMDKSRGSELWDIVAEAGKPWEIGPGNPNQCERIESGLLSYGGDTDDTTNPFELGLGKYVDVDVPDDVVGIEALRRIKAEGPKRQLLGVIMDTDEKLEFPNIWFDIQKDGIRIGDMVNCVFSRRLEKNIGYALVDMDSKPEDAVNVRKNGKDIPGALTALPFI